IMRMARRIGSFSSSLTYLECILTTRLSGITWLKRPPYGSGKTHRPSADRRTACQTRRTMAPIKD
ncbi:MAG: hypothetical protein KGJ48_16150, partial [Nitrospirota bacterium]|nr:hypothetical protein [Nitrospirota bacterium]